MAAFGLTLEFGHYGDSQKVAPPQKVSEPKPNPWSYQLHSIHLHEIWDIWLFETNPRPKAVFNCLPLTYCCQKGEIANAIEQKAHECVSYSISIYLSKMYKKQLVNFL
ncbi:MAG: hypothetical protein GY841_10460 [FCB group bacterium]|nr:hypothetical protein [FCB group bacterium]